MKKTIFSMMALSAAVLSFSACNNSDGDASTTDSTATVTETTTTTTTTQYLDLNSGNTVELKKDESSGQMVSMATGEPVEFYVDMNTRDTFYGKTGTVVNNAIVHTDDMKYKLDDSKVKWDGNELKIENADGSKVKADEDEYKYKSADGKTKVKMDEGDGKIKTPDQKIKVEDGKVEKVKNR